MLDFVHWLREKLSGNKELTFELQRLESKYEALLKEPQKAFEQNSGEIKKSTDEGGVQYSIVQDEKFLKYCDSIDLIEASDDISKKGQYIEISQQTPHLIVEKANTKNLPMAILFDTAYLETRRDGKLKGNYHNLGSDNMKNLPKSLENPECIVKLENGRLNVIVDIATSKGSQTLVSVELDQSKQVDGKFNRYNLIITAFGAKSSYLEKIVNNPKNQILFNKKTELQGTDQLHKRLDGINNSVSNNRVAQNEPSVNNNSMQDSKEYSMPSETDTDYTAEMDALDERFKNR